MLPPFRYHYYPKSSKPIHMFSIDVKENNNATYYSVLVDGHDYETDHYNPWTHNNKFKTVSEAVAFKRELDKIEWDNEDRFDVREFVQEDSPILYDKYGDCFQTYLHKRDYDIYLVQATCSLLNESELRKHFIDDVLKEV